jgi:hypothetical protein
LICALLPRITREIRRIHTVKNRDNRERVQKRAERHARKFEHVETRALGKKQGTRPAAELKGTRAHFEHVETHADCEKQGTRLAAELKGTRANSSA